MTVWAVFFLPFYDSLITRTMVDIPITDIVLSRDMEAIFDLLLSTAHEVQSPYESIKATDFQFIEDIRQEQFQAMVGTTSIEDVVPLRIRYKSKYLIVEGVGRVDAISQESQSFISRGILREGEYPDVVTKRHYPITQPRNIDVVDSQPAIRLFH